jgi:hypothetical protein
MLAYLDALIGALSLRDRPAILRLLAHPLARILPADARAESESFAADELDPLAAPLRVMQLRHQTAELLRETPVVADRAEEPVAAREIPGAARDLPGAAREIQGERSPSPRATAPLAPRRPPRMVQMELPLSA